MEYQAVRAAPHSCGRITITANGIFTGGFFGPGAKEAGYTFQIAIHNPTPYS
jgi:hypothetical protein